MHPIIKPLGLLLFITLLMSGLTSISTNSPGLAPNPTDDRHDSTFSEWEDAFVISKDKGVGVTRSSGSGGGTTIGPDDDKISIDIEKHTNGYDGDNAPGPEVIVGSPVEWTYNVTNTGDLPLQDIAVADNDSSVNPVYLSGDANENEILDSSEVWIYNASGVAEEGQYTNIGSVTAYHGVMMVYDEDLSHYFGVTEPVFKASPSIDLEKHTNGYDNDTAPGLDLLVGSPVEWTYYVNNTGNVNLTDPVVLDNRTSVGGLISGDDGDGVFEPGEVWVYNASGFATAGQYVNLGNVTAYYEDEKVYDEDLSHYFGVTEPVFKASPSIDLEKHTNGHDNDTAPGLDLLVGSPVEWTYYVNNTGNVNLTDPVVLDNRTSVSGLISGDDGDGVFEPGEVWVYNASDVATAGQYVNLGNVTAYYEDEKVYDEDLSHYFGVTESVFETSPSIELEKHTNGHDNDTAPGLDLLVGSPVEWTYYVNNTGNVNLTDPVVLDNRTSVGGLISGDDGDGVFEPGEVWVYNASDIAIAGQYVNLGNVTAYYEDEKVYDEDLSHYFGVNASIDIEKFTDGYDADEPIGPYLLVGYPVEWTYNVTNTGNVNLVINVQDNDSSVSPELYLRGGDGDNYFEPGEVWVYNASGTVIVGQYCNIGNVTGSYGEFLATDEDPSYYFGITNEELVEMLKGQGYWKNNPDDWPVEEITIGNETYTKSDAIDIMGSNEGKPYIMFVQLVAAKLNVMAGSPYYPHVIDGESVDFIAAADAWMESYPLGTTGSGVEDAWNDSGEELKNVLEMYNNGTLYSNG
ncbi:hypothetical protein [Methanococcoides sp. AM1]|uniref:DUF7507 domain-containing protein n=1 Tax=Methanococcoides sp. AM1 TaxID=1201011 RepID=UPI0010845D9F|nr:hypothetical protein [Methanococcoides sp. AM1]